MPALRLAASATHSISAGPKIITELGTGMNPAARTFSGQGAPSKTTLSQGNAMYNAATSGFVVGADLFAPGAGYAVGQILEFNAAVEITVDGVDATGAITDWHVSNTGPDFDYPSNPVTDAGANGTAKFNLHFPPPDYYIDMTTPTAPVLYVCTLAGNNDPTSNGGSTWAKVSGGSGSNFQGVYVPGQIYNTFDLVLIQAGPGQGEYISTMDNNTNSPLTGIGWIQVSWNPQWF